MQLYVSVDAATKESLKAIDRPLFGDFWERFLVSASLGSQILVAKLSVVILFLLFCFSPLVYPYYIIKMVGHFLTLGGVQRRKMTVRKKNLQLSCPCQPLYRFMFRFCAIISYICCMRLWVQWLAFCEGGNGCVFWVT